MLGRRQWSHPPLCCPLHRYFHKEYTTLPPRHLLHGADNSSDWSGSPHLPERMQSHFPHLHQGLGHIQIPPSLDLCPCLQGGRQSQSEQYNLDRKSTRLNSSHVSISYAVFC